MLGIARRLEPAMHIRHAVRIALVALVPALLGAQQGGDVQTTLPQLDAFETPVPARRPIAIGGAKQLFIDRKLIETTENVLLTVVPPERHPANPVLRPETPADGQYLSPNAVLWNPERKLFQLWYSRYAFQFVS
jgi:hypothetical protein